jgi:7-cyano-7-deazaguanine tRNA-ribosyltransferase
MFELIERDGLGRIGILNTKHGEVITPALMPVINPNLLLITPKEMENVFGAQIVITNSYIIHKKEELREKALKDGVHGLLDFQGAVMTDSGTFQSHVYGDVDIKPAEIVEFQKDIGSDIGTILDLFSEVGDGEEKVKQDVEGTIKRAKEAVPLKGDMALACTVQGGNSLELRTMCAEELSKLDCDIHPIGSVVPLMESYRFRELVEIIIASKKGLVPSRPVHLFGCGHPMLFGLAVLLGCDLFDSASYAKYAKDGRLLFPDGTRKLKEIVELPCGCPVCSKYHVESIKEMFEAGDTKQIAMHNLHVSFVEIKRIKQAIHEGSLWEFVEERCRTHPNLLSALKTLKIHKKYLERYAPTSRKGAFFYTGPESIHRPIVYRYEKRFFERYRHPKATVQVGFEEGGRPFSRFYRKEIAAVSKATNAHFIVNSVFGPVPIELDEMYPIAQSVIPDVLEPETVERMIKLMERHSHKGLFSLAVMWDGDETLEFLGVAGGEKSTFDLDMQRVRAVSDMQFGKGAQDVLVTGKIELVKSKKTGKIRNVISDGKHILSMRAGDGLFTLKIEGAKRLHKGFTAPNLRVVVEDDSVEFNREGKNVFAKFVVDCDEELRPRDEVLIVDKNDELVAVGRAVMNREEMLAFNMGVAVRVREGLKKD